MNQPARILIVDDDPIVRSALTLMLGGQQDLTVVGEANNGRECLAVQRTIEPDVVLMDLRMPELDGIEATRQLRQLDDAPTVIVLTTFDTDDMVLAALAAGAEAFLLKDTPPDELVDSIRIVHRGDPILSTSAVRALLHHVRTDDRDDKREHARRRLTGLTDRELQVARAISEGQNNAEIADHLHLSIPTVKTYVSRLLDQLGATNRVQIAICIHQAGITP